MKSSKISPFAQSPLISDIGRYGEQASADEILAGTYAMTYPLLARPDADVLGAFITALTHPNELGKPIPTFSSTITQTDFQAIMKPTREKTSSSPLGIYMGHEKAAALDDDLSDVEALAITLPFRYGFTYHRWQYSIHCML